MIPKTRFRFSFEGFRVATVLAIIAICSSRENFLRTSVIA